MKDQVNTHNTRVKKKVETNNVTIDAFNNICKKKEHTLRTGYPTDNTRHICYDPATKKMTDIISVIRRVRQT